MTKLDAIGQVCPMPVIMIKNALKEVEEGNVEISVDNKISKENVEKFAKEMGYSSSTKEENGIFFVNVTKSKSSQNTLSENKENDVVIVISSNKMGDGDSELGLTLMKGFIYTLSEMDTLPKYILFYNSGVYLTTTDENTIQDLKLLESRGVEILSCGACLNFYHLENSLKVGSSTNMYSILDKQMTASKVIKP